MQILDARRVLFAERRGSSWPVLVETDTGVLFTKLRGAAQGVGALVAEAIVAELAESLGLQVPARTLVRVTREIESVDRNDELADLLQASEGLNLGFSYLEGAKEIDPASELEAVRQEEAAAILWLDGLTANPDRTARNPNLLWWRDRLWLIDHGAALGFQYALPDLDSAVARQPYTLREPHLLQARVGDLSRWDESFAGDVTRAAIESAVGEVPDAFLQRDRRASFVEYLTLRLEAPRPFVEPVVTLPSDRPRRGRPAWLARRR